MHAKICSLSWHTPVASNALICTARQTILKFMFVVYTLLALLLYVLL